MKSVALGDYIQAYTHCRRTSLCGWRHIRNLLEWNELCVKSVEASRVNPFGLKLIQFLVSYTHIHYVRYKGETIKAMLLWTQNVFMFLLLAVGLISGWVKDQPIFLIPHCIAWVPSLICVVETYFIYNFLFDFIDMNWMPDSIGTCNSLSRSEITLFLWVCDHSIGEIKSNAP